MKYKYYTSPEFGLTNLHELGSSKTVYLTNNPDNLGNCVETTVADVAINTYGNYVDLKHCTGMSYSHICIPDEEMFKDKLDKFIQDLGYNSLDDLCDLMLDEDPAVSEDFTAWLHNNGYVERNDILNISHLKEMFNHDDLVQLTRDLIDEVLV